MVMKLFADAVGPGKAQGEQPHHFREASSISEVGVLEIEAPCFQTTEQSLDLPAVGVGVDRFCLGCARGSNREELAVIQAQHRQVDLSLIHIFCPPPSIKELEKYVRYDASQLNLSGLGHYFMLRSSISGDGDDYRHGIEIENKMWSPYCSEWILEIITDKIPFIRIDQIHDILIKFEYSDGVPPPICLLYTSRCV